jgi:hypothetical protein
VAYVVIGAVIDVPWTRQVFSDRPDDFFIAPRAVADEVGRRPSGAVGLVLPGRGSALRRAGEPGRRRRGASITRRA